MAIEILKFKPYVKASLLGFFDIQIPKMGIDVYGCTMHKKGNQYWINLPSREYKDESGETKYIPVFKFINNDHYKLFKQECLTAVKEYIYNNNIQFN